MKVREPAVAGLFYPAGERELRETLAVFLDEPDPATTPASAVGGATMEGESSTLRKAVIAPHAGYAYSGPVAATAYRWLAGMDRGRRSHEHETPEPGVTRVILIGPAHRVPFQGLAVSSADAFGSPLGLVPVDQEARERISALSIVRERDDAHELEHSLEVHLPFLQSIFSAFRIVPVVVGDAGSDEVGAVLRLLWGGAETVLVVSSDLSHYLGYDHARRTDRDTARAIESLRSEEMSPDRACGAAGVSGLLSIARERGLEVRTLDLRSSGDTAGPRDRVVGYGAFGLEEPA